MEQPRKNSTVCHHLLNENKISVWSKNLSFSYFKKKENILEKRNAPCSKYTSEAAVRICS